MRKLVIAVLLASVAGSPAFAQSTAQERRAEREKARAERAEQAKPSEAKREERRERADDRRLQASEHTRAPRGGRAERIAQQPGEGLSRPVVEPRNQPRDGVTSWRQEQREQMRRSRADRVAERGPRAPVSPPPSARPDVPAPPPATAAHSNAPRWQSSWHNDRRYDWRDHRRRHGSIFRVGFYFDPFGWSYQRYNRGWRLWPSYYQSSYWLHDPMMYRLPYAPHPYRWIRYWDDALLVDTYSGQVVDVVHDFFW